MHEGSVRHSTGMLTGGILTGGILTGGILTAAS